MTDKGGAAASCQGSRYFVGAILRTVTPEEITRHFSQYGPVSHFELSKDDQGKSRGYGFLTFQNHIDLPEGASHEVGAAKLTVNKVGSPPKTTVPTATTTPVDDEKRISEARTGRETERQSPEHEQTKRPRTESEQAPTPSRQPAQRLVAHLTASLREAVRYNNSARTPYNARHQAAPATVQAAPPLQAPPPSVRAPQITAPVSAPSPLATAAVQPAVQKAVPKYVCIPLELCPPHFLRDPRVFCADLDPTRVGSLVMSATMPDPTLSTYAIPTYSQDTQGASDPPPPPGPPPPPPPGPPPPHRRY